MEDVSKKWRRREREGGERNCREGCKQGKEVERMRRMEGRETRGKGEEREVVC